MLLAASLALAMTPSAAAQLPNDPRMNWWREAKFGMFIHWGLYAVPAGKWGERDTYGEWIRDSARIPIDTYDQFRSQFNPVKFDADAWVQMAKDAGMKYIVITTKHHDGFSLFDSAVSDFDIMNTPFKRDIMKELAEACRRHGIKMCWYHSIMDWHHPDYLPRRGWEAANRPAGNADFNRYNQYLQAQVTELLTKYGDIGIMWFDGQWESTWNPTFGKPLYDLCRKLQANVIVNNRVYSGPGGGGDYLTPEQEIPAETIAGQDWETCMTMNRNWGYNAADKAFKSTKEMIHMLADIASKGGNYLMNIGPTAEGLFPPESVQRLRQIGTWMRANGESIYGTQASPFGRLPWGRCTLKRRGKDSTLYLHIFDWPSDGRLRLSGLGNEIEKAYLLESKEPVKTTFDDSDLILGMQGDEPSEYNTVIALEVKGAPIVYAPPLIESGSPIFIRTARVSLNPGSEELQVRYTTNGAAPDANSKLYTGPFAFSDTTTVKARTFHKGR
ncbi:MAG TPA: alpha-L-fucosidase, partial [Fimbriimonadaceae bacterium]|nr:alpha-L-fucosidase [Fimbriimonadaceae bacterium]